MAAVAAAVCQKDRKRKRAKRSASSSEQEDVASSSSSSPTPCERPPKVATPSSGAPTCVIDWRLPVPKVEVVEEDEEDQQEVASSLHDGLLDALKKVSSEADNQSRSDAEKDPMPRWNPVLSSIPSLPYTFLTTPGRVAPPPNVVPPSIIAASAAPLHLSRFYGSPSFRPSASDTPEVFQMQQQDTPLPMGAVDLTLPTRQRSLSSSSTVSPITDTSTDADAQNREWQRVCSKAIDSVQSALEDTADQLRKLDTPEVDRRLRLAQLMASLVESLRQLRSGQLAPPNPQIHFVRDRANHTTVNSSH